MFIFQTKDVEDAVDDTWIVSGQSVIQQELLEKLPHGEPIKVMLLRDLSNGWALDRNNCYYIIVEVI